jgi:hypothetical protein
VVLISEDLLELKSSGTTFPRESSCIKKAALKISLE